MNNIESIKAISCLKGKEKIKVLFVCLGNICRSPAAEGIMRSIVEEHGEADCWEIDSAGTGNYHIGELPDNRMRIHARRRGLELQHHCRQVTTDDFYEFDLIVPMDASNETNLKRVSPSEECDEKIVPMAQFFNRFAHFDHVPDPYYSGAEGFERVLDLLQDGCETLFNIIKTNNTNA
ncbi:MAG: low molecular weight phosphotyrosine protein phosphatase [Muribaculaceae bacterium]|nr:low molecular weight phosphotyrosine protein phosphatase [Muribaculaceae bacterium]